MNSKYYKYLDSILIRSKFRIDFFLKGADILLKKFPEISSRKQASMILIDYIVDTDPYNRLSKDQLLLF